MNRSFAMLLAAAGIFLTPCAIGQQLEKFGKYEVHYNVLNSDQIPAQVAQGYGIQRSASRALLNIAVLDTSGGPPGNPRQAEVDATTINLTGQRRDIDMRQINEPEGAIYYIGELPVTHLETYNFTVTVKLEGEPEPFVVSFRQQFFTE